MADVYVKSQSELLEQQNQNKNQKLIITNRLYFNFIEMSDQERTRYFEYMRPRYSNPSFASSNVGASLGMLYATEEVGRSPVMKMTSLPQVERSPPTPKPQASQQQGLMQTNHRRSKSLLSNYGTTSLGSLPKYISERDIYEKQQKKYNIITIQPKQYNETIKKYPKYRLQNMDQNYYKKLKLQDQYNQSWAKQSLTRQVNQNPEYATANKELYMAQNVDNGSQIRNSQQVLNKQLQEKLMIKNNSQAKTQTPRSPNQVEQRPKAFRPKMLNNIDQLSGVL